MKILLQELIPSFYTRVISIRFSHKNLIRKKISNLRQFVKRYLILVSLKRGILEECIEQLESQDFSYVFQIIGARDKLVNGVVLLFV